jgi:hypothetical protein
MPRSRVPPAGGPASPDAPVIDRSSMPAAEPSPEQEQEEEDARASGTMGEPYEPDEEDPKDEQGEFPPEEGDEPDPRNLVVNDELEVVATVQDKRRQPSVGRIVHYISKNRRAGIISTAPRAAMIVHVFDRNKVTLVVWETTGEMRVIKSIGTNSHHDEHWAWPRLD